MRGWGGGRPIHTHQYTDTLNNDLTHNLLPTLQHHTYTGTDSDIDINPYINIDINSAFYDTASLCKTLKDKKKHLYQH